MHRAEPFIRGLAADAALATFFALVAVLHTWPLSQHLSTHVAGQGIGDNATFIWNLWWMREALGSADVDFFSTDRMIAPHGAALILHAHTALTAWLGATLAARLTIVEALNTLLIAFIALNGLAAYGLARDAGGTRATAALAGALFMLAPPLTVRLMGHFNFIAAWPFVLALWALLRVARRPSSASAAALGAAAALTAYAESYLFVFLVIFGIVLLCSGRWSVHASVSPRPWSAAAIAAASCAGLAFGGAFAVIFTGGGEIDLLGTRISARSPTNLLTAGWLAAIVAFVIRWRPALRVRRVEETPSRLWPYLAGAAVLAAVLAMPMLIAAWEAWMRGVYIAPRYALKTAPAGVDLATLVLGPPFSGAIGETLRAVYERFGINAMESSAWLGILPLGLGVWAVTQRRGDPRLRPWIWLGAAAFLWSLGPYATLFGWNTGLPLPQGIAPALPLVSNARMPGRALILVSLSLAVLAAVGLRHVRRPALVASACVLLAFVELTAAPLPLARLPEAGTAIPWLAAQPRGTVVHLPFGVRDGFGERGRLDHGSLYLQSFHGHPVAGGFMARLPTQTIQWYEDTEPFASFLRASRGERVDRWPSCRVALDGLRAAAVRYLVVERDGPRPLRRYLRRRLPVTRVAGDEFREVYVLEDGAGCRSR